MDDITDKYLELDIFVNFYIMWNLNKAFKNKLKAYMQFSFFLKCTNAHVHVSKTSTLLVL